MSTDLKAKHLSHYLEATEQNLRTRGEKPDLPLTIMPGISKVIGGFPKGQLIVIGARTSNGKSVFAANTAYDLALQGKKVLFLSLEMVIPRIIERLFCNEYRIHNYHLKEGGFATSPEIQTQFADFKKTLQSLSFVASDMIGKNWQDIDNFLTNLKIKPDAVFIDHIQEVSGNDRKKAMEDYLRHMRELCIRDHFALIICSQLNRLMPQEDVRIPQLHHLKGTGYLEEACDIALLLHWPYHYDRGKNKNYFEVNVAKNKDGEPCYLKLNFEPQFYKLSEREEIYAPASSYQKHYPKSSQATA